MKLLVYSSMSQTNTSLFLPAGVGSSNNYAYLVSDDESKDAVIIDPANPPEYVSLLSRVPISLSSAKYIRRHSLSFVVCR